MKIRLISCLIWNAQSASTFSSSLLLWLVDIRKFFSVRFCSACIYRSYVFQSSHCPLCWSPIELLSSMKVNLYLDNLVRKFFPMVWLKWRHRITSACLSSKEENSFSKNFIKMCFRFKMGLTDDLSVKDFSTCWDDWCLLLSFYSYWPDWCSHLFWYFTFHENYEDLKMHKCFPKTLVSLDSSN